MVQRETFLSRWARLKQEGAKAPAEAEPLSPRISAPSHPDEDQHAAQTAPPTAAHGEAAAEFDPASLPSLETIDARSDISAFLARGVPAELTKAALRRVWAADPAIRDFVGLSENAWDFTAPGGVPGFGPLLPGDDVRAMLAHASGGAAGKLPMSEARAAAGNVARESAVAQAPLKAGTSGSPPEGGHPPQAVVHEVVKSTEEAGDSSADPQAKQSEENRNNNEDVATRNPNNSGELPAGTRKRTHGGALPS